MGPSFALSYASDLLEHPLMRCIVCCRFSKRSKETKDMSGKMKGFAIASIASSLIFVCGTGARAQEPNPTTMAPGAQSANVVAKGPNGIYVYHVKVVQRELDAVNYVNRSGSTHVNFVGTELMPSARGDAKVASVTGKTQISVHFSGLTPANGFGKEYLTYVLWAISADGRPQNLGELELAGDKASLDVSSSYQSFGMIVTAEPYFAVSQPSDVVVLKNVFSDKTQGVLEEVNVHYQLLPRGLYANTQGARSNPMPVTDREHVPLALFEAYNAQRIALQAGADRDAPDIMQEVQTDLTNAQAMQDSKHRDVKMEFTDAREAVERAEDARLTALRKQDEKRQQDAQDAKQQAQMQAQQSQMQAQQSQLVAQQAQAAADRAAAQKAEADAARARAEADAANARAQAAEAQHQAAQSQQGAEEAREKLRTQLNSVLETTETARGLIVHMGDVLFATSKYALKPDAQVSLAKVATILTLYPNLKVQIEGYTDSTGAPAYNQTLSENRADSVRDFLVQNGVPQGSVSAQGFGATNFVADNATAAGRQQNRRVNLVVSGASIGVQTQPEGAQGASAAPAPAPTPAPPQNPTGTSNPPQ